MHAQPAPSTRRIGVLQPNPARGLTASLLAALRKHGWTEGHNLVVESRYWGSDPRQAEALTRELVAHGVELIVTNVTASAIAALRATREVPIVLQTSGYPVEGGLAKSLSRPGGNVTGLTLYAGGGAVFGKFVELLRELVPSLQRLGVLWGYAPPAYTDKQVAPATAELRRAARALNVEVRFWPTGRESDLAQALAAAGRERLDALFVTAGIIHGDTRFAGHIGEFVRARRLPVLTDFPGHLFSAAAVLAYSVELEDLAARAASYVDRILRGARPGDLPIEQPTKYQLIVNLKTATAIGLAIPAPILLRADRVIE